jgi:serine protease AprX
MMRRRKYTPAATLCYALLSLGAVAYAAPIRDASSTRPAATAVGGPGTSADAEALRKVDPALLEKSGGEEIEFLIFLDEQADLAPAAGLPTKIEKGEYVFEATRAVAARTQPALVDELEREGAEYKRFWVANMIWVNGAYDTMLRLAARPEVARIYDNTRLALEEPVEVGAEWLEESGSPTLPSGIEWNLSIVNAPDVWAEGVTGEGVVIAGIDTGYDWEHPALKRQYRGWDGAFANHNYNWHDAIHSGGAACPSDSKEPCDDHWHGTHTMGIMVGDDGMGGHIGMAPGARWIGCRAWEPVHETNIAYVTECLQWIIAPTDLSDRSPMPALAPHTVNNSWVCTPTEGCSDPNSLRTVIENVRAAGIVVLGGVGNDGPGCGSAVFPPPIYESYFSVGATTISDAIASFSSRGPVVTTGGYIVKPDISAPGQGVRSTAPGGTYLTSSGTSFAGPHVAGLVALLISANRELEGQVDQIEDIITETAVFLPTGQECGGVPGSSVPNNTFGYGRIDAYAAFEKAMELATPEIVELGLDPCFPNPFSSVTNIVYRVPSVSDVRLRIFDAGGRLVKELVNSNDSAPDEYEVHWDGRDHSGRRVSSGVYFCKLEAAGVTRSRRLVFIR